MGRTNGLGYNSTGVIITADMKLDGRYLPVSGYQYKLHQAANSAHRLPRIHTLVVAKDQEDGEGGIVQASPPQQDPADIRIIVAKDEADAMRQLQHDQERRRRFIHKYLNRRWINNRQLLLEQESNRLVGRQWLMDEVEDYIQTHDQGYILITAPGGVGKSAIAARLFKNYLNRDDISSVACHFIKREGYTDWDEPEQFIPDLEAQIRQQLNLYLKSEQEEEKEERERPDIWSRLNDTLHEASRAAIESNKKLLIIVDGLDEVFGRLGQFKAYAGLPILPGKLEKTPAPGLFFIFTSRPDTGSNGQREGHLDWLADPNRAYQITIDEERNNNSWQEHRQDLKAYIKQRCHLLSTPDQLAIDLHDEVLQSALLEKSQGLFIAARSFLGDSDNKRPSIDLKKDLSDWKTAPNTIPNGLTEWVDQQIGRMRIKARQRKISQRSVDVVLGVIALTRAPLTRYQIVEHLFSDELEGTSYHANRPVKIAKVLIEEISTVSVHKEDSSMLELLLDDARELFSSDVNGKPIYRYLHSLYPEIILKSEILRGQQQNIHHLLGWGCARWQQANHQSEAEQRYWLSYGPYHLKMAMQTNAYQNLLTDFHYAMARLQNGADNPPYKGALDQMRDDYETVDCDDDELNLWAQFIRQNTHHLQNADEYWPSYKSLYSLADEHGDNSFITQKAEAWRAEGYCDWYWIKNLWRPKELKCSPLIRVIKGHSSGINGAIELSDGRILSWSDEILIWSAKGNVLRELKGHEGAVKCVLELTSGRLLSWAWDRTRTLRLWDAAGKELAVLKGHYLSVDGVLKLTDGRFLSWSADHTLLLWGAAGEELAVLKGHAQAVEGALELTDGRFLSWSADHTLRLWGAAGEELAVLKGHAQAVEGALELTDGRFLSWSADHTLRLWDTTGAELKVLDRFDYSVTDVLELTDGRLLSWSRDEQTLCLRDAAGEELAVMEGHDHTVDGALELTDGRVLSWSADHTLRLWDTAGKELAVLKGHAHAVKGALELTNGRLLSWSPDDYTLRLWNNAGKELAVLQGHDYWVKGALELTSGRLLSWSWDHTLRLWDTASKELVVLKGHAQAVKAHWNSLMVGCCHGQTKT